MTDDTGGHGLEDGRTFLQEFIDRNPSQVIIICNNTDEVAYLERHALRGAMSRTGGTAEPLGAGRYLLATGRQIIFTSVTVNVHRILQSAPPNSLVVVFYNEGQVEDYVRERIEAQIEMLAQQRSAIVIRSDRLMNEIKQMTEGDFTVPLPEQMPLPPIGDQEDD